MLFIAVDRWSTAGRARDIAHEGTSACVDRVVGDPDLGSRDAVRAMGRSWNAARGTRDVGQLEIDTVRGYIAALGGKLKIVADFEDHDVTVSTVERDRTEIYACRG